MKQTNSITLLTQAVKTFAPRNIFTILFSKQVIHRTEGTDLTTWRGCQYFPYGQTTIRYAATLKDNVINALGFLERQKMPDVPAEAYAYFSNLKHKVINNDYDFFRLLRFVRHLRSLRSPYDRIVSLLKEMERLNYRENCRIDCSITRWQVHHAFRNLLNLVPYNLTVAGMPLDASPEMDFVHRMGGKMAVVRKPSNEIERDLYLDFGPSLMYIIQELQKSKHCFNENFFGHLLTFYPWPTKDSLAHMALGRLRYYFTHNPASFLACGIYTADLYALTHQPWSIFDYVLNQMDSSGCERSLDMDIKKLIMIRQQKPPRSIIPRFDVDSMLDLLSVISAEAYPTHIVMARARLHRYFLKLLPYINMGGYVRYFYDTPEEQLLSLLNYISQVDPYPISDISHCIRSIKSHLIFQTGPKHISSKLLNLILDAWWTPDLLDEIKANVIRLKLFVRAHFTAIDKILTMHNQQTCAGIVPCYMKIVSLLEARLNFTGVVSHLHPPNCFIGNFGFCYSNSSTAYVVNNTNLASILRTIDAQKYSLHVVMMAQNLMSSFSQIPTRMVMEDVRPCTKEEILLHTLERMMQDVRYAHYHNELNVLIAAIKRKIGANFSELPLLPYSPPTGVGTMNTQLLINLINKLTQGRYKPPELEAAIAYIQRHAAVIDGWLAFARCQNDVSSCFASIMDVIKSKADEVDLTINLNIIRFAVNPTYCTEKYCEWLPYEELECGTLNPVLAYIALLLNKLKEVTPHFQLQIDIDAIIKLIQSEDIQAVLSRFKFNVHKPANQTILEFLQILQDVFQWHEGVRLSTTHLIDYLLSGDLPKVLSVQNLFRLIQILNNMVRNELVASTMLENIQLLYKNKEKLQKELSLLNVDCRTLDLCVGTLALEANYTSGNAIINSILNVVSPKLCTVQVCPWITAVTQPNKVLSAVLNELVTAARDSNTPLLIKFAIDRLKKLMQSPKFQPILQQLEHLLTNDSNPVITILNTIAQRPDLLEEHRRDAQNVYNYIRNKIPPQNLNIHDFNQLLTTLKETTSDAATKEKIRQILDLINKNPLQFDKIISSLFVDCKVVHSCVSNLYEALRYSNQQDRLVMQLTRLVSELQIPREKNLTELYMKMQNKVNHLIRDFNVPFHIQLELKQIQRVLSQTDLTQILNKVVNTDGLNLIVEVLQNLPVSVKLQYGIEKNAYNVIQYLTIGILPTRIALNTLKELAYVLVGVTSSPAVKSEITQQTLVLQHLPESVEILEQLPVKCDSLQSCADTLTRNIRQLPIKNQVTQTIYNTVNPPSCTQQTCPWISGPINLELQQKTNDLRQQLQNAVQGPNVPLLVKIYADELLKYITPEVVLQSNANSLLQLLDAIAKGPFSQKIRHIALALLSYIDRNIEPKVWTHEDFFGLGRIMMAATTDLMVHRYIMDAANNLMFHGPLVDALLNKCEITGADLKTVVMKIYECTRVNSMIPSSSSVQQFIFPPNCQPISCPWTLPQENATELPQLIQNAVNEINFLINGSRIPYHVKLDLMQVLHVITSKPFLSNLQSLQQQHPEASNTNYNNLIEQAKQVMQGLIPHNASLLYESALCKLFNVVPGSILNNFNIFRNVVNILNYLAKGQVPSNLEMNTLQQLFEIMASSVKDRDIARFMMSQSGKLGDIWQVVDWLNSMHVNCTTYESCIHTLMVAISHQNIPNELYYVLHSILQPANCTKNVCEWLTSTVTNETLVTVNGLRNQLMELYQNKNTPLHIKLAVAQILRLLTAENFSNLNAKVTLGELLAKVTKDKRWTQQEKEKVSLILQYIQHQNTTAALSSCKDLHSLAQHMLQIVPDFLVQQEIRIFDNRLYYHEADCDLFIKHCRVNCNQLQPCVQQLYECTKNYNTSLSRTLALFLHPPSCTQPSCSWVPPSHIVNPPIKPSQMVIIFFHAPNRELKMVMLDLNNQNVVNELKKLSTAFGQHPDNLAVVQVQVAPGNYLHIPIDLTNQYVQNSIVAIKEAMKPIIDCNTMKVVSVLWPFRDGHIRWLTFDLTNEETRKELKRLSQRQCALGKPTIPIRDVDGSQYVLCIDYTDVLLLHEMFKASVEGKRIIKEPTVLFWPREVTECWGALEIDKLGNSELAILQNFPTINTIGIPTDILISSSSVVSFAFDVYNRYVREALNTLTKGVVPSLDLNSIGFKGLLIPNDFGRLTNVYVNFTDSVVRKLISLSKRLGPNDVPSFYLTKNNVTKPICLNVENMLVKQWLMSWYLPVQGLDWLRPSTDAISQIVSSLREQLQMIMDYPGVPFIVKLNAQVICNTLQLGGQDLIQAFQHLPTNVLAILRNIVAWMGTGTVGNITELQLPLIQCLQYLPAEFLNTLHIKQHVVHLIDYLVNKKVTNQMDIATLQALVQFAAKNIKDTNTIHQIHQALKSLVSIPNINPWLQHLNVSCETYEYCVNSITSNLHVSGVDKNVQILIDKLWTLSNITTLPGSQSVSTLNEIIQKMMTAINALTQDQSIPFVIKLNLDAIAQLLKDERVLRQLYKILESLPPSALEKLIERIQNTLFQITNNVSATPADVVTQLLEFLPYPFVTQFNLKDCVDAITMYFTKGTLPNKFNLHAIRQIAQILANSTTSLPVASYLKELADKLLMTQDTQGAIYYFNATCNDLKSCIDNIANQLHELPGENEVAQILQAIVQPQNCTVEICSWIVREQEKKSPIIQLLDKALEVLTNANQKDIPLHLVLDAKVIAETLQNDKIKQQLEQILNKMPQSELQEILQNSQLLLDRLNSTNAPNLVEVIVSALQNLPNSILQQLNIAENVNNIRSYFEKGVMPSTISWQSFKQLMSLMASQGNSSVVQKVKNILGQLEKLPDKDKVLGQVLVQCYTLQMCTESLKEFLSLVPEESQTTHIITNLVNSVTQVVHDVLPAGLGPDTIMVLPINHDSEHVVLNIKSEHVVNILEKVSNTVNTGPPKIILEVAGPQSNRSRRYIMLDTNDVSTVQLLKQLEHQTAQLMKPSRIANQFGSFIVGIVPGGDGQLKSFVVRDDEATRQQFLQHSSTAPNAINLPFSNGTVSVLVHPTELRLPPAYVCYLPNGFNVQPIKIVLPGGNTVTPIWSNLQGFNTSVPGATLVPIITGNGNIRFIFLDLKNKTVCDILKQHAAANQIQVSPQSVLVTTVKDHNENPIQMVLNLNDEKVLQYLNVMSQRVNTSSDKLICFNYVDANGKVTPITIDMNAVDLNILQNLAQLTPANIVPIYVKDSKSHVDAVVLMVTDSNGKVRPAILNMNDAKVTAALIGLNEPKNSNAIPVLLKLPDGRTVRVYIDKNNPTVVQKLLALSAVTPIFEKPVTNVNPAETNAVLITVPDGSKGHTVYRLSHLTVEKIKKLMALAQVAPPNAPYVLVTQPDGSTAWVQLDLQNPKVREVLENISDSITTLTSPNNWVVITDNNKRPMIIDISHPGVLNELLNISAPYNPNAEGMQVITVADSYGNYHNIVLNMTDAKTQGVLQQLQSQTSPHIPPTVVPTVNGTMVTILTVPGKDGQTQTIVIDDTNKPLIDKLISESDMLNLNATKVVVFINEEPHTLYLDLNNRDIRQILEDMQTNSTQIPLPTPPSPEQPQQIITMPVYENGHQSFLKCDLSKDKIVKTLLNVSGLYGKHPVIFKFVVKDWTNSPRVVQLDTLNPQVLARIRRVCVEPPSPEDILLVTVTDKNNNTISYVLNTKDATVMAKLRELSNMTQMSPNYNNATVVQIKDIDGHVVSVYLDLTNEHVLKALEHLHDISSSQTPSVFVIKNEKGEDVLLVMRVTNENGNVSTVVLDTSDPKVYDTLQHLNDPNNINAIPVTVNTNHGVQTFYIDRMDPLIISSLIKLSKKRLNTMPAIVKPNIQQTSVIQIPFTIGAHTLLVTIDVNDQKTQNILMSSAVAPSSSTKIVYIKDLNGIMKPCYIDTTDAKVANLLTQVAAQYEYNVEQGSLMIVPITDQNGDTEYVILDLTNENVTNALMYMSDNFGNPDEKVIFYFQDKHLNYQMCKLDLYDEETISAIRKLQAHTVPWIKPSLVVNPYGPLPFYVTTIADHTGNAKAIVLDTNDQNVMQTIYGCKTAPEKAKKPLEIKYFTNDGTYATIVVDLANPQTLQTLLDVSKPVESAPSEILSNRPSFEGTSQPNLVILVENEKNQVLALTFDTSNPEVFNGILNLASPPGEASSIIYIQTPTGDTTAIRINTKDEQVVNKLKHLSKDQKIKVDPSSLAVIVVRNNNGESESIVIDLSNPEVVGELRNLTKLTAWNATTVILNVNDLSGRPLPVALDIYNPNVIEQLKKLQAKTPQKILPVYLPSPAGPLPLCVFTLDNNWHRAVPIVLDLNNQHVVRTLMSLSQPGDPDAFVVEVLNGTRYVQVFINPENPETKKVLIDLTKLCPLFPIPIISVDPSLISVPIEDTDGTTVEIQLDPTDGFVKEVLARLPKNTGPTSILPLPVQGGSAVPVAIGKRDVRVAEILKQLGKRLQEVVVSQVTSPTGPLPLVSFFKVIQGHVETITLDPNLPNVISDLAKFHVDDDRNPQIKRLKLPGKNGATLTFALPDTPQIDNELIRLSRNNPLIVQPLRVILPGRTRPLLGLSLPVNKGLTTVTLDLEDDYTLDELRYFDTGKGADTITLEFNTPNAGKVPVSLNIKDPQIIDKLKHLTPKVPVRIVPLPGGYPILALKVQQRPLEEIYLDIGNPEVVKELIEINKQPDNSYFPQTEITLKNKDGLNVPISIGFDNPKIFDKLKRLSGKAPVQPVTILQPPQEPLQRYPIRILPPGKTIWPLIFLYDHKFGVMTLNPNNYRVMNHLLRLTTTSRPGTGHTLLIRDVHGNMLRLVIDLNDARAKRVLKQLKNLCPIQLEPKAEPYLPTLIVKNSDRFGMKPPLQIDLQNPDVLATLTDLSRKYVFKNPYKVQVQTSRGPQFFLIDFNDPRVISTLERLRPGMSKEPYFINFEVPDTTGNIWNIVLDLENEQVMDHLWERSNKTTAPGATIFELKNKQGHILKVRLNLFDVSTVNLLKILTKESTGKPAEMVKKKPQKLMQFAVTLPDGRTLTYKIDTNNESVMRKLKNLSDMFNGHTQTVLDLPSPDGSVAKLKFDFTDPITLQNIRNLQEESLGGKPLPLIPLENVGPGSGQKMLLSFSLNSPHYGDLTFVVDLYLPGMTDKLQALSNSFEKGRPETQVPIDDQRGRRFILLLDLTNPNTIETLAKLTEESTGENPLQGKQRPSTLEVYSAELLTIELPYGIETIPISFDTKDPKVVTHLQRLDRRQNNQSLTIIDIEHNGRPIKVALDTSNRHIVAELMSFNIPTAFPAFAPRISLITLIFLPRALPIEVDLAISRNVLTLIQISKQFPIVNGYPTFLEARDDTGQYLRIPVDLNNPSLVATLTKAFPSKPQLNINATSMPYLVFVVPVQGKPHAVVKIQTKPKVLKKLVEQLAPYNGGIPIQIVDILRRTHNFQLNVVAPQFVDVLLRQETAALIGPSEVKNFFIVYLVDDKNQIDPIYLNMNIDRTVQAVRKERYVPGTPLSIIQHLDRSGHYQYEFITLADRGVQGRLSQYSYAVGGHSIIKQTLVSRVVLTVPAGNSSMKISLNLADPRVLQGIQDITAHTNPHGRVTTVELEDGYGFPIILKFDYTDLNVLQRLKSLSSLRKS
ncbi:hypothetical protein Trydic_g2295 [Trypoxylus dichotomus]